MIKNLKNLTEASITLGDFHGVVVAPNETIDGLMFGDSDLRNSIAIAHHLIHEEMSVSDGINTWLGMAALDFIRGVSAQVTKDGKQIVTTSDRPANTYRYYSAKGDDMTTGKIGEGTHMTHWVAPGEMSVIDVQYIEDVWAKDGEAFYYGVEDHCHVEVLVVVPAGVPFPAPSNNGNYDNINGTWTANATWTGQYMILGTETVVFRFVNMYPLMHGGNRASIESPEPQFLPTPYKLRTIVHNNNTTDHIRVCFCFGQYRSHTYNGPNPA